MSDCDCQKNIKKPINDGSKKPNEDGLLIAIMAAATAVIFFSLRIVGMRQDKALSTSTLLVYLLSLFDLMIKEPIQ